MEDFHTTVEFDSNRNFIERIYHFNSNRIFTSLKYEIKNISSIRIVISCMKNLSDDDSFVSIETNFRIILCRIKRFCLNEKKTYSNYDIVLES